jgi:DNA-binding NarL/FixJ family response regulator
MRIIIVDGDGGYLALVCDYIAHFLPEATITPVLSAEAVLEKYDTDGADLVVTDHYLPRMQGLELIQALQARDSRLPTILHAGDEWLVRDALDAGARAFVLKGAKGSLARLVTDVRQVLSPMA